MAVNFIYKYETKFDNDHNFSIDLTSSNEIQNMVFKERNTWLVEGLKILIEKFVKTDEFKQVKKVSDFINKIKTEQKNVIVHR